MLTALRHLSRGSLPRLIPTLTPSAAACGPTLMNMRIRHLLATLLFTIPAWSGSIYGIAFSGKVTQGTLIGILDDQTRYIVPFTPGSTINGVLSIDLSLLPPPTVTPGANVTQTTFRDADVVDPRWISGQVNVSLPALPDRALPVFDSFSLTPLLPPPGAIEDLAPIRERGILWNVADPTGVDNILPSVKYQDAWRTATEQHFKHVFLSLLISSSADFLPVNGRFSAFDLNNLTVGSVFQATILNQKPVRVAPLFGIENRFTIAIDFTIDRVFGGIEGGSSSPSTGGGVGPVPTPEPGTVVAGLTAIGLALVRARRRG
ncbi:MAG: hypothetical protein NTV70_13855 [Acidobacteria bacterium]|nr:hypothetical protein [Acidobacteriota bacterium]